MAKTPSQKRYDLQVDLVKTYTILGGNLQMAAKTVGIPYGTARRWKDLPVWERIAAELQTQEAIELSPKLKKIVDKSLELVQDRLERGDFFYDQKTGKVERKPVSIRDAHVVMKDTLAIKNEMERAPIEAKQQQNIQDTLAMLAKNFEELASKQKAKPKVEVTDVIFLNNEES